VTSETQKFFLLNSSKFFPVPKTKTPYLQVDMSTGYPAELRKKHLTLNQVSVILVSVDSCYDNDSTFYQPKWAGIDPFHLTL